MQRRGWRAPLLVRCKWSQKSRRGHDLTRSHSYHSLQEEAHCVFTLGLAPARRGQTGPSCSTSAVRGKPTPSQGADWGNKQFLNFNITLKILHNCGQLQPGLRTVLTRGKTHHKHWFSASNLVQRSLALKGAVRQLGRIKPDTLWTSLNLNV